MWFKFQTYILILILSAYWVKPIVPLVEYVLMKDYIVQNLCVEKDDPENCCQGMCHLEKEIEKNDDQPINASQNNSKKYHSENDFKEFVKFGISFGGVFQSVSLIFSFHETTLFPDFLTGIFVPPDQFV